VERALSSEDYAFSHSPHTTSQESIVSVKNGFPTSNREFLRYLFVEKSPGEVVAELEMARLDVLRASMEWFQLRFNPIFEGIGVPRGQGKLVIATGFGTPRIAYRDTETFFGRIGYDTLIYDSGSLFNVRPVEHLVDDFMNFLQDQEGDILLFCHSKGGLLAFATYATHKDKFTRKVKHVCFVGSPRPDWVNVAIGSPYFGTQLFFGGDDFKFASEVLYSTDIENVDGTRVTSICNPRDLIIRGKMFGRPDEHRKVDSSHLGMHVNKYVLKTAAERFAELEAA